MAWTYIIIAGSLEIIWVYTMKLSQGFTVLYPSIITIILLFFSFYVFSKSMTVLSIGTAYAAFTGIGTIGSVTIEFINDPDTISPLKIIFLLLLIIGIIGLKFSDNGEELASEVSH